MLTGARPYKKKKRKRTTTDSEKDPGIDSQAETKGESNVEKGCSVGDIGNGVLVLRILVLLGTRMGSIGDLGSSKGEEEEEKGADKLAHGGDEVIADLVGKVSHVGEVELSSVLDLHGELAVGGKSGEREREVKVVVVMLKAEGEEEERKKKDGTRGGRKGNFVTSCARCTRCQSVIQSRQGSLRIFFKKKKNPSQ